MHYLKRCAVVGHHVLKWNKCLQEIILVKNYKNINLLINTKSYNFIMLVKKLASDLHYLD